MENEMRLIDANELMDKVEGVNWYHIDKLGYLANGANSQDHTPIYKAEDIYNAIRNAPTVDAVPVVHGHWEFDDDGDPYCSVCRKYAGLLGIENGNYCPKCGAKMDGGNNNGC